jgi:chromosomal replication initiation ATPase DnaA
MITLQVSQTARRAPPRAYRGDAECVQLCRLTGAAFAMPVDELRAAMGRSPLAAFARQTAMYLAHTVLGRSFSEVGLLFDRDRTMAAHACRLIEERRDDPAIDALHALEGFCAELAHGLFALSGPRA